jgi:hypothetical protein
VLSNRRPHHQINRRPCRQIVECAVGMSPTKIHDVTASSKKRRGRPRNTSKERAEGEKRTRMQRNERNQWIRRRKKDEKENGNTRTQTASTNSVTRTSSASAVTHRSQSQLNPSGQGGNGICLILTLLIIRGESTIHHSAKCFISSTFVSCIDHVWDKDS